MLLACFVLGFQTIPKVDPAVELFRWFDSLGYEQAIKRPFVRIVQLSDSNDIKPYTTGYGYLLADRGGSFDVLLTNLARATYTKKEDDSTYHPYAFVPAELSKLAASQIRAHKEPYGYEGGVRYRYGYGFEPSEGYGGDVVLAWMCKKSGLRSESDQLVNFGKEWCSSTIPKSDFLPTMKGAVASGAYSRIVLQFESRTVSRVEILSQLREHASRFQGVRGAKEFEAARDLLENMVAEDIQHEGRGKVDLADLSEQERIAELIWQLRDNRHPRGYTTDPVSPKEQLERIGRAAIPQLLDALKDRRFTRIVGHAGSGPPQIFETSDIKRIRDVAQEILSNLAGRSFIDDDWRDRIAIERSARKWWAEFQTQGEKNLLIAGVKKGDSNSSWQASKLAERFPNDALAPIKVGYRRAKDENDREAIITAVRSLPFKQAKPFLLSVIANDPHQATRISAEMIVAAIEPDLAIRMFAREWNRLPSKEAFGLDAENIYGFLLESGRPAAITLVYRSLKKKSAYLRFQVVSFFTNGCGFEWPRTFPMEHRPTNAADLTKAQLLIEDLLASELKDGESWGGAMSIAYLEFSGSISEVATYCLSRCFPNRYKFVKAKTPMELERQRITSLNAYRSSRGLATLPMPTRTKKPMRTPVQNSY